MQLPGFKFEKFAARSFIPRMSKQRHPIKGEYVTAIIPVRTAILESPDLRDYATRAKDPQLPGLLTPDDFPSLTFVSRIVLSLTHSASSKTKVKTFDKSELDSVKRKLEFAPAASSKSAAPDQKMLGFEMSSFNIQDTPSLNSEKRLSEHIFQTTEYHGSSVENEPRCASIPPSPTLTIVVPFNPQVQNPDANIGQCHSRLSKEAPVLPNHR